MAGVPSYLSPPQLSEARHVFPAAARTPAVPAGQPGGGTCIACTCGQARPVPHHGLLLAGPPGGHEGPSEHCPHAPQSQLVPHG